MDIRTVFRLSLKGTVVKLSTLMTAFPALLTNVKLSDIATSRDTKIASPLVRLSTKQFSVTWMINVIHILAVVIINPVIEKR